MNTEETKIIELNCLPETEAFGLRIGRQARAGDIITLAGSLGAGKTTLVQFIGRGLQVPSDCYITSPTFSLMHEYPGRITLYHMDLYRISAEEIIELGFEEYMYGEGLTVIEWSERLEELMPENRLHIELEFSSAEARTAKITRHGTTHWDFR